jgi:hypothetical protein
MIQQDQAKFHLIFGQASVIFNLSRKPNRKYSVKALIKRGGGTGPMKPGNRDF